MDKLITALTSELAAAYINKRYFGPVNTSETALSTKADLVNRAALERAYQRIMGKLLEAYGGRLLEKLGDPPNLANIPPDFWDEEAKEMVNALAPFGERVYLDAASQMMQAVPGGVDWALVNRGAVDWARRYTFDLVGGLTDTNRQTLQSAISAYYEQGQTMGDLERRLMNTYSRTRAEMIAVTEVTRAASEGEQQIARELAQQGINLVPVWQTNNDGLVCPICGPKHNREIKDGQYPPAHPRCRCWVNHEIPSGSDNKYNYTGSELSHRQQSAIDNAIDEFNKRYGEDVGIHTIKGVEDASYIGRSDMGGTISVDVNKFTDEFISAQNADYLNRLRKSEERIDRLINELNNNRDWWSADDIKNVEDRISRMAQRIADGASGRYGVSESMQDVIIHELGHQLEPKLFSDVSEYAKFMGRLDKMARNSGSLLSEYATTNGGEYFAEAVLSFIKGDYTGIDQSLLELLRTLL